MNRFMYQYRWLAAGKTHYNFMFLCNNSIEISYYRKNVPHCEFFEKIQLDDRGKLM